MLSESCLSHHSFAAVAAEAADHGTFRYKNAAGIKSYAD